MEDSEVPEVGINTEAKGIFPSEIILRSAIVEALADLRRNAYLLDHIFASLPQDVLTASTYGMKSRKQVKDWFLQTEIPVFMDYALAPPEPAAISIVLVSSAEEAVTLGDLHYQVVEDAEAIWPPLTSKFTPVTYNPITGLMELPASIGAQLYVVPGMIIVDHNGGLHTIADVTSRVNIELEPGITSDFTDAYIKGSKPKMVREIESLSFRENYRITAHFHGDPMGVNWVHSILMFCLLRYKQDLFEARGIERTTLSSGTLSKNETFGAERYFSRAVEMTGYIRTYWPKLSTDRILSVSGSPLEVSAVGIVGDRFVAEPGNPDPMFLVDD